MPQGLPKKIEVALLFADLALELRDPTPRRRSIIENRAPQRRAVQPTLARSARPPQRLQTALPNLLLPFVQTTTVDLQIPRNRRHLLASRNATDRSSLKFRRKRPCSLHQSLSFEKLSAILLSHFGGALHGLCLHLKMAAH
jgi:hypothetical protein